MINYLILLLLIITQVLGDIFLAQAMKLFGEVTSYSSQSLLQLVGYLMTSPWIYLGVFTLIASLLFYLIAISRLDLSYVLPIQASSYVLNALLAWLILGEQISWFRALATLMIAIGVFLVSWTETRAKIRKNSQKSRENSQINPLLGFLSSGFALSKVWLGTLIWALSDGAGDLLMAYGMKQIGAISLRSPLKVLLWILQILTHPIVLAGIFCYTISFLTFISLLSWADISLVRPMTALTYGISLLGAKYILQETIKPGRLLGILVIGCGIVLISLT